MAFNLADASSIYIAQLQPDLFLRSEMPCKTLLTEQDIVRCFNGRTVVQARELLHSGKVVRAWLESPGWLFGSVRESGGRAWEQVIGFGMIDGNSYIEGRCTCDRSPNCAHVAAVLLYYGGVNKIEPPDRSAGAQVPPSDPDLEQWLRRVEEAAQPKNEYPPEITQRLLYVLRPGGSDTAERATLALFSAKLLKDGGWSKPVILRRQLLHTRQFGRFMRPVDIELFDSLATSLPNLEEDLAIFLLKHSVGARILGEALQTGRCRLRDVSGPVLFLGPSRPAEPIWAELTGGSQRFRLTEVQGEVIPLSPPWYVDPGSGLCGPLDSGLEPDVAETLLCGPPVLAEHSNRVRRALSARILPTEQLLPASKMAPTVRKVEPSPHLKIGYSAARLRDNWGNSTKPWKLPSARLTFKYAGMQVSDSSREIRTEEDGATLIIPRNIRAEDHALIQLTNFGWVQSQHLFGWSTEAAPGLVLLVPLELPYSPSEVEQDLYRFVAQEVPRLREEGWQIEIEGGLEPPQGPPPEFVATALERGLDWFDIQLGIRLGSDVIDLRPILASAFDQILRSGAREDEGGEVYHLLPDGRLIGLPVERLRPILQGLIELFGRPAGWGDQLRLSTSRAGEVARFDDLAMRSHFEWQSPERLSALAKRLDTWEGIRPETPPDTFKGTLREYQQEGFGWLNFLAEFGFGGILADDMGLGKTVQTLAHILAEQAKGRLDRPALVVAPTSTLPNWEAEIARFAPGLRVLKLHGSQRSGDFGLIPHCDLVLTSYPLLARDCAKLTAIDFHIAVLDEAQNIKNHNTNVAKAAFEIKARHRVALSGTPIENHVQELWSIFRFALPGLLGNAQEFRDEFRHPIEKLGDKAAQVNLIRRIRPFILRRTKQEVATELPPKTVIVDRVQLEDSQRDLYESVRLAMDDRIRKLVASRGLDRSRIEVLDALLKLRQVCCDPRLVKLPSAAGVTASAKLERLMEMLEELLEEGRKVLLFSQFTSMLDLIEPRLREQRIEFVRLSGDTDDRATPVKRFQKGEVPLFLISLKAGGTGLNLTAADTVIHYDPWWNPAVENQATDRAHRIGQDKPVFVFKLVATDTVEEKILELQARKADLAERLLAGSTDAAQSLSAEELKWIFG